MRLARETIARMSGQPWLWNAIRGRAAIARGVVTDRWSRRVLRSEA